MKIKLEPKDWRYSAAILGLYRYLENYEFKYSLTEDYLEFNEEDITEEGYLRFVEKYFEDAMHHREIEKNIDITLDDEKQELERKKKINEKMNENTIMKKVFSKMKYDGSNGDEIKKIIKDNRMDIIKKTYFNGDSLYKNFCTNKKGKKENILEEDEGVCRLNGYYVDMGKKSKGHSYKFDNKTFTYIDDKYFDFIPFGFSKDRESFFINASVDLEKMKEVNSVTFGKEVRNPLRSEILLNLKNSVNKLDYDVEIIVKDRENKYFETLYIRKEAIEILEKISEATREALKHPCNVGKPSGFSNSEYIQVEKLVTDSILNLNYLDGFIEFLFKIPGKKYLISHLITVNRMIYKEEDYMSYSHRDAREDAEKIKGKLLSKSNKLRAYEQKLISAISLKDYDKVKEIMIHLSSYTQMPIRALIPLCENFEKNKNLAYTFINSLGEKSNKTEGDR